MTKAQMQVYNRLRKRQVNRGNDVVIVQEAREESEGGITFYVAFPGLYMTYDRAGKLLETMTKGEWEKGKRAPVKLAPQQIVFHGELSIDDDDVPF
jgi:hypothetical protein